MIYTESERERERERERESSHTGVLRSLLDTGMTLTGVDVDETTGIWLVRKNQRMSKGER